MLLVGAAPEERYRFRRGFDAENLAACLGLLTSDSGQLPAVPAELDVQRGRRGRKPPERLLVIGPPEVSSTELGRVRFTGMLKATARATRDAAPEPGLAHWWLGLALAQSGYLERARWKQTWRGLGLSRPELGSRIERVGPWLVWAEHLERRLRELVKAITTGPPNPLRSELDVEVAMRLLKIPVRAVAGRLLEALATEHALRLTRIAGEPVVLLSGQLAPPPLAAPDAELVGAILASYAAGSGAGRPALAAQHPGRQHLVRWLFDAGLLVEAPDGYVFTRDQLRQHLATLSAPGGDWASASIRELKDRLGLKRRVAEALHAWLSATYVADPSSGGTSDE